MAHRGRPKTRGSYTIPAGLHKRASEYMVYVVEHLNEQGRLTPLDHAALDMLAWNYSNYLHCQEQINGEFAVITDKQGSKKNPLIQVMEAANDRFVRLCKGFGLTTFDRMKIDKIGDNDATDSPLARLLAGADGDEIDE
jgi:P27 family predicted phage terminase small subunit